MKRLKSCCFCVSLETAGKIFGWFSFIGSIIAFLIVVIVLCSAFIIPRNDSRDITFQYLMLLVAPIASIVLVIIIVFSWKLIKGISERNPKKVSLYKLFLIILMIILMFYTIYTIFFEIEAYMLEIERSKSISVAPFAIIALLWLIYEIFVIHSLELMYRKNSLPVNQPHVVTYHGYPRHQAPFVVSQPYYGQPSQHQTAYYPKHPSDYRPNNRTHRKS